LFWKVKNLNPAQGFEHVKGYAGLAAGKAFGVAANMSKHFFNNIEANGSIETLPLNPPKFDGGTPILSFSCQSIDPI